MEVIARYDQEADVLVAQYESLSFERVHASLANHLPATGGNVLDVGAGSGRDAAWLAKCGYSVVAVEPSEAMRSRAIELHGARNIRWIPDKLPDLAKVQCLGLRFDLIIVSAVWMHIPVHLRGSCLRSLALLLSPIGKIAISLRLGEPDAVRKMHAVSLVELSENATQLGLRVISADNSFDHLGRVSVSWTTAILAHTQDSRTKEALELVSPQSQLDN